MKTKILTFQLKKYTFLLMSFFFLLLIGFQSVAEESCLTPQESSKKKFRYRTNLNNKIVQETYYLKVYVHVIRKTDGTGGFNAADVDEIIGYLDTTFNPHQIYFAWDNEIDFIDDDIRAIYGPGGYYDDTNIFTVNNHTDGIDMYLYPGETIAGAGRANGVGESSEFWVSGMKEGRPSSKSYVVAHEMGHVLNLWHTHHGCETGDWEATDGSNCESTGDFVCDTPSDPRLSYLEVNSTNCEWSFYDLCGAPESIFNYNPDTKNIMSYSAIDCRSYFSAGQGERMLESIATLPFLQATITNVSTSACNMDDWNALQKLYNWTYGDSWTNNTNWDILKQDTIPENCSLRGLHGITFDATGRVTTINLYNNNLIGTLPDEIGNLANLKYLDLGFNTIGGTINDKIGNLSDLEILFLDNNQFTGGIPLSFLNLDKLVQITLSNNYLGGCFDVQLGAWCNRFSASSFSVEGGNNNFEASFDLFCENASGICPIERCDIEDWRALKQFYESTNGDSWTDNLNWEMVIDKLPPADCDLRKLRGISLNIEGNVMGLDLFDNNLTGYLPNEIGGLSELTYVDLGFNLIEDTLPSSLSNLDELNTLLLDNNNFNGNIPAALGDMESLAILYLNNNNLTGCPDTNLTNLCNRLSEDYNKNQYLSEGNNLNIDWEDFCTFGIDSCEVSPCEADWYALKQLYLSTNGENWDLNYGWEIVLEDNPPLENCNLGELYGVDVDSDGNVIEIDLTRNNLIGSLPPEINNLANLEILDLCLNDLTDSIPNLSDLKKLTKIDFNNNELSGNIPSTFGNLSSLTELNLSDNSLTGSIPGEMGSLSNLITLRIFNNDLSGCYAVNLKNLCTSLSYYYYNGQEIDFGNNFDALWIDFCNSDAGICAAAAAICNSEPELNIDGLQFEAATFHSAQKISSNAVIEAETTFKAGESIELMSGFETNGANNFQADIENCE